MNKKALLIYSVNKNTGLSGKVKKLFEGFVEAGFDTREIIIEDDPDFKQKSKNILIACKALMEVINDPFDVIYIRYLYYFFPIYLLCVLFRKPYQIEINNNNKASLLSNGQKYRAAIDAAVAGFVLNNAACVHVVTRELAAFYRDLYPKAYIVYTPNFVVDEQYQPGERRWTGNDKINLVFMGDTEQDWHGMPLFIESVIVGNAWFAASCRLHIVGRCSPRIDALIVRYRLAETVIAHGFLSGKGKHDIINDMDIGVGCFNLPLIGLREATAIKIGEYLYSGLHLILGAPDSRLSADLPFVSYIDLLHDRHSAADRVKQFVTQFRCRQHCRAEAHDFARQHLLVDGYIRNIVAETSA